MRGKCRLQVDFEAPCHFVRAVGHRFWLVELRTQLLSAENEIRVESGGMRQRSPAPQSIATFVGDTFQICSQYSRIALSEENLPARAVLRIDMRVQRSGSPHAASTRS